MTDSNITPFKHLMYTLVSSLLAIVVLLLPFEAFALDVVWDNATSFTACVSGASCNYTYVIGSVSNPFLYCDMVSYTSDPGVTTMTYNGASMTQIGSTQNAGALSVYYMVFYLKAPATGSHTLTITPTTPLTNGYYTHCASFANADQTSPLDGTTQVAFATAASITLTVSTTTANIIAGGVSSLNGRAFTATAPAWKIQGGFDSQASLASATTSSMTLTTSSDKIGGTAFGIKAFVAAGASVTPQQTINIFSD